jgi:hypothetical protein
LLLLLGTVAPGTAVHAGEPAGDTQLLATPYGELCSVCEGFLKCRAEEGRAAADDLTVYHIKINDFWQQIATIGDWFLRIFRDAPDERRHLAIYTRSTGPGGKTLRTMQADQQARLSLQRARIEIPGGWIDRRSGSWHRDGVAAPGRCEVLNAADAGTLLQGFNLARP